MVRAFAAIFSANPAYASYGDVFARQWQTPGARGASHCSRRPLVSKTSLDRAIGRRAVWRGSLATYAARFEEERD